MVDKQNLTIIVDKIDLANEGTENLSKLAIVCHQGMNIFGVMEYFLNGLQCYFAELLKLWFKLDLVLHVLKLFLVLNQIQNSFEFLFLK